MMQYVMFMLSTSEQFMLIMLCTSILVVSVVVGVAHAL